MHPDHCPIHGLGWMGRSHLQSNPERLDALDGDGESWRDHFNRPYCKGLAVLRLEDNIPSIHEFIRDGFFQDDLRGIDGQFPDGDDGTLVG